MKKLLATIGGLGLCLLAVESMAAGALAVDAAKGSRYGLGH